MSCSKANDHRATSFSPHRLPRLSSPRNFTWPDRNYSGKFFPRLTCHFLQLTLFFHSPQIHILNMENGSSSEGKDPSAFLSEIIGAPVIVKLNSGVVYKGICWAIPLSLLNIIIYWHLNRRATVSWWLYEHCSWKNWGVCEWKTSPQLRGCLRPRKQWSVVTCPTVPNFPLMVL